MTLLRNLFIATALNLLLYADAHSFSFTDVKEMAKTLSESSYVAPEKVPKAISELSYDQHRDIRFRQEETLWRSSKNHFDVQMLHTGGLFNYGVKINILDAQGNHPYLYNPEEFDVSRVRLKKDLAPDLGFAGFRLRYPLNNSDTQDEVIVFAGGSYFRAVSKDTLYGLSARGLAIDTALPSGEEFPIFREFWLQRPSRKTEFVKVFALLDSKSISGAYEFTIFPGDTTRTKVKATLFPRKDITEVGIAPLTSMFFIGENTMRPADEWRPEIHDSDGLLLENGTGEVLWRPLTNEKQLRISMFSLENPKGFGLLQRDRHFSSYEDLETHQERRPSAWITPIGDWGKGQVKLTEIPTNNEYNDNIVTYWVPQAPFEAGKEHTFQYWLDWNKHGPQHIDLSKVSATRIATHKKENTHRIVIDYSGEPLSTLLKDWCTHRKHIKVTIETDQHSSLESFHISKNPQIEGIRLSFAIKRDDKEERTELRAHLSMNGKPLTEIWTHLLEQ